MTAKTLCTFILASTVLAACGGDIARYSVPPVQSDDRVGISFASVEVREVNLPTYASLEEIFQELPDGALQSSPELLWADDPARAITLELARYLGQMTSANVAAEPWPFEDFADARVEVRVEEMLAGADGRFRMSGQYYVAPSDDRRGRTGLFRLSQPYPAGAGAGAIAAARGEIVQDLALQIAREGLR